MSFSHQIDLQVAFHDLDPMQIVWHGNYFKYFDQARFALFDAAGINLYDYLPQKGFLFPVTRSAIKHIAPLLPNDRFTCKATVTEARYKIAMQFEIRRRSNAELCTRGSSEQVAVKHPDMALDFEIPLDIRQALGFE